jgi:hypothetical protein
MEVATWHGLVTNYVLVVMDLSTRRVHLAGMKMFQTGESATLIAK